MVKYGDLQLTCDDRYNLTEQDLDTVVKQLEDANVFTGILSVLFFLAFPCLLSFLFSSLFLFSLPFLTRYCRSRMSLSLSARSWRVSVRLTAATLASNSCIFPYRSPFLFFSHLIPFCRFIRSMLFFDILHLLFLAFCFGDGYLRAAKRAIGSENALNCAT